MINQVLDLVFGDLVTEMSGLDLPFRGHRQIFFQPFATPRVMFMCHSKKVAQGSLRRVVDLRSINFGPRLGNLYADSLSNISQWSGTRQSLKDELIFFQSNPELQNCHRFNGR